ncbi:alpha/beta fold hydrolase [Alteribacter populi]|uniref:alpha/beta fold hydrolase n=1 Tax=Alteribacter populi TaxID=2011011 RepID=UPI000BBABEDA|nr:alpha/beta fold hydrolase [Alteribacter populi]
MSDQCSFLWVSGWSVDSRVWEEQMMRWPERIHKKVDFNGCKSVDEMMLIAEAALKKLTSPVVIVGWSLGAMTALDLAYRHPDRVHSVFLIGGTGQFIRSNEFPHGTDERSLRRLKRQVSLNPKGAIEGFDLQMFSPSEVKQGKYESWQSFRKESSVNQGALEVGLDYLRQFTIGKKTRSIRTPAYLLTGIEDAICPYLGAKQLEASLPQSEFTCWDHAGHLPFWTEADRFFHWMKERVDSGIT